MDNTNRSQIIGLFLIVGLFFLWTTLNTPSKEEIDRDNFVKDSIRTVQLKLDSLAQPKKDSIVPVENIVVSDSIRQLQAQSRFGAFYTASSGTEGTQVLENDVLRIVFNNKGGHIQEVELKNHKVIIVDKDKKENKVPLKLLNNEKNKFSYFLPIANLASGGVSTADLFFTPQLSGNTLSFRAYAGEGYFEQVYTIKKDSFEIDYTINMVGLKGVLNQSSKTIKLEWVDHLNKLERNADYERNQSSIYYKPIDDDTDYCSCTGDDLIEVDDKNIEWVSHAQQFFNTTLIAEGTAFTATKIETKILDAKSSNLKKMSTDLYIPLDNEKFAMKMYIGPNEYNTLAATATDLENIVPYGSSIFGTVNRWIVRPIFNFLMGLFGMHGLVIIVLTLLVKLVLYPLTYKMLYSQAKMAALKPRMAHLKDKHKDDSQKLQMENMKMYQEFGVNPLGGCLPMVLQMPIWIALYRFFPATIEFRQASFLWATDLSSFDVIAYLPEGWDIPMYGAHISLFTVLWAAMTVLYSYYNAQSMDMSAMNNNPMMKYMQYFMPIMFMVFFNQLASGLTCYLFFSSFMNVAQTVVTKNYIIDKNKIEQELNEYKKKPKKSGGFQERLQNALREQQKIQKDKENKKKKK